LRTVDGVVGHFLIRQSRHAAPLDGAKAKPTAAAVHHEKIANVYNNYMALETLKTQAVRTVRMYGEATDSYDALDYTLPTAFVLGAEGQGMRRLVRETCDRLVRIPMGGLVGSLNVSVAAGVVLFEAARQRRPPA
jgi:23S rRNA (guanosine2251-2'-O)-methyltransferase